MSVGLNIDKVYQYLLIFLAFLAPLTVFGANLVIFVITILWFLSGKYKIKFTQITNSKLMISSILFFVIHLFGLLWTEDLNWGLHITKKMWYFLLLYPILYTIVKRNHIQYYIAAFLLAISITEFVSYLIWFEVIPPFKNATINNPTPFMSHISYNPILAFAIYLVAHKLFFNKKNNLLQTFFYGFFALSMTFNMFITGGRAGQVMFFVMIAILFFQIFNKKKLIAFVSVSLILPTIFLLAYNFSDLFFLRINAALSDILTFSENKNTSVGQRISYTINSLEIIKKNLFLGVGTGDFPMEYMKINVINSPEVSSATNPHNMYILVLSQLGLLGLISMMVIFYYQIKCSIASINHEYYRIGLTLPLLYLVIMLSDSYLLGHYTTLIFIFFSAFLHNNFEKN